MKASIKAKRVLRLAAIAGLLTVLAVLGVLIYLISQPCVNPGCGVPAALLTNEGSWMNSPTSLTMLIRNSGRQSTTLSSYYVQDSAGHSYSAPAWTGPTIQPNSALNVTLTIDGRDFTFQPYSSYTATVHDSRDNDNWTFSVSL